MFIKKIFLVFVILITLFGVSVFKAPGVSNTLEGWLGLEGLGDKIRGVKSTVDKVSTDIPTLDEVKNTYDKAYSGAIDAKNTLQGGIKDTKNFIDGTRKTLSGAEAIYNDAKGVYDETKEVISGVQDKIDSAKEVLEDGKKLQK
ncbi:hypothetical protein OAN96_01655, partial [Candidatus Gracilibacteria bacterium]|nr:hypothetical protein [Candidatus Gracilibacteria bacterium]